MSFNAGQIIVFDRAGHRLGVLTGWSVSVPRSYALNEIEDFGIILPLLNQDGTDLVTATMANTLLLRDNLIYVEDEMTGMPGWGGAIESVRYADEQVEVKFLGGLSLAHGVQTDSRISQTGGTAAAMAQRLISAANAKKGAHGDLQLGFRIDGSSPLYGTFEYEGDIYSGLSTLASDTLSEFWPLWTLGPGGTSLTLTVVWDRQVVVNHTAIHLSDNLGEDSNLKSGSEFFYSAEETLTRIRLKGAPTHLADFLDYDCIKAVVKDVSPEVDWEQPSAIASTRLREDLTLSVNFGLSDDMQRQIATTGYDDPQSGDHVPGIQDTYLGYYKSFLYAYHNWQGKPFLEGYDWSGPDGQNDKSLTLKYFRTWNKMARKTGPSAIITADSDGGLPNAVIDEWTLDTTIDPAAGGAVGVALDWGNLVGHWVADASTGNLLVLDEDESVPPPVFVGGDGEPFTPPAPYTGARRFALPVTTGTVNVPGGIDPTGATDVASALQSWIDSQANGSVLNFPTGAIFRLGSAIQLSGRNNLIFEGNGTTLLTFGPDINSSGFVLNGGNSHLTIRGFTIHNDNADGGTVNAYHRGAESSEGLAAYHDNSYIEFAANHVTNVWGHGVYAGTNGNPAETNSYFWIYDNLIEKTGLYAVVFAKMDTAWVEHNDIRDTGGSPIGWEDGGPGERIVHQYVGFNTITRYFWDSEDYTPHAIAGDGETGVIWDDITIDSNRFTTGVANPSGRYANDGAGLFTFWGPDSHTNIRIINNTSDVTQVGSMSRATNAPGIVVQGNNMRQTGSQFDENGTSCPGAVIGPNP